MAVVFVTGDRRAWADALKMSVVGLTLAFCIAIGTGGGIWLDKRLGTEPAFTVVGFLLGAIAGFRELFRAIQKG